MKRHFWALGTLLVAAAACAAEPRPVVSESDSGTPGPLTWSPDSGLDGAVEASSTPTCIGTECPDGFATCLSGAAGSASHKCGVNLLRDNANCGACGNACLTYDPFHMISQCVDGACELQCFSTLVFGTPRHWSNCNGKIDDGCEVDVYSDPNNCGTCGNVCAGDTPCVAGKCGCPTGKIACGGRCVDPLTDDNNCGKCGIRCNDIPVPNPCSPLPPQTRYGCGNGECGQLRCRRGTADCDGDLPTKVCESNGCEVEDLATDPNNCGGCAIKCAPHEVCIPEENSSYCGIPCEKYGRTLCDDECIDLLNDPDSCGACGFICPSAGPHRTRSCQKGVCSYECIEGFADCNGDPVDGCEVDLRAHPENCGACGNKCDLQAGQPCIDGKCLLVDCNDPGTR